MLNFGFLCSSLGCASHIIGGQPDEWYYYAVERGRVIELARINLQETGNPWNPVMEVLVETCPRGGRPRPDRLPCWPRDRNQVTQELLDRIWSEVPRGVPRLLYSGEYLNREFGTFHRTWVVGTYPLAFAFLDEHPDLPTYEKLAQPTTWPTSAPGVIAVHTRSGEVVYADKRIRYPKLVSDAELNEQVNVLLLYPDEIDQTTISKLSVETEYPQWRVRVIVLRRPVPLRDVMQILVEPDALERQTAHVVEIPVRR